MAILALVVLWPKTAPAQNAIVAGSWEGFVTRTPEGKFDRCVLYNKTIRALNAAPYTMLGITRDGGGVGLMAFYEPRTLTRDSKIGVEIRIGDRPPMTLPGDVKSDFHVVIPGPLDAATLAALRDAGSIEITAETKPIRFSLANTGAALDRLADCVSQYAR